MNIPYSYTVLRYIHDTISGEFVNVGIALYAPKANFLDARIRTTFGRLTKVFPGFKVVRFRHTVRTIGERFQIQSSHLREELPLNGLPKSVMEIAHSILPDDDGSLQWSAAGSGLTSDPAKTLEALYERMVTQYEKETKKSKQKDLDVYRRIYKPALEEAGITEKFRPKKISVPHDEKEFEYACKNGKWHFLEPLSLDLSNAEHIKDKAHKLLGTMTALQSALKGSTVHYLLGAPQEHSLAEAYMHAKEMLKQSIPGFETRVVEQQDAEKFSEKLAKEIKQH